MKRDMDFIRQLLLDIEDGKTVFNVSSDETLEMRGVIPEELGLTRKEADKLLSHINLLEQVGYIEVMSKSLGGVYTIRGITWEGHDFLDSVRDPKIWEKTKKGAEAAGGFTVDLLKDLAKGLVKKQVEEYTGVKLL